MRIAVMMLITWYPLFGSVYVMYVNEAIHEWCFVKWAQDLSNPRSKAYYGVRLEAEWCTVPGFRSGRATAQLMPKKWDGTFAPGLVVNLPGMEAEYPAPIGESVPLRTESLDAAFVQAWMKSQGVDAPLDEAEFIRAGLEFHGESSRGQPPRPSGEPAFYASGSGYALWEYWNPWWYWPAALALIAAIWTALAFAVRPRSKRTLPYPSRA